MEVVFKSLNPIEMTWAEALLREQGLEPVVLDSHMAALYGQTPLFPLRLAVADGFGDRARRVLAGAGVETVGGKE